MWLATLVAALSACGPRKHEAGGDDDQQAPARAPEPAREPGDADPTGDVAVLFDQVVRAERVFPEAAQRALYEEISVQVVQGDRVYGFMLKPQPGMQENRHFHIITVAVARVDERAAPPSARQTFGPNGGLWDVIVRTADGRYDIRLSEGMLLPDSVHLPRFDLARTAQALSSRYSELTAGR
jgi:hypothetical protein